MPDDAEPSILRGELCPACGKETLTLMQKQTEIPYFGDLLIFSMRCEADDCEYFVADVEAEEEREPVKVKFKVETEADLNTRVVKSSTATVKIGRVGTIESSSNSSGYITNIEGILNRMRTVLQNLRDTTEDTSKRKKAKRKLKKIRNVLHGDDHIRIWIEDPNGNSIIVSEKAEVKPLK